ncbi:MAG: O-antigen ligase [Crocinitomix sp.]|jgi:O-antigen ligase
MMKELLKPRLISVANIDLLLFSAFLISFLLHYRLNGFIAMLIIIFGVVKLVMKKLTFRGGLGLLFLPGLFLLLVIGQLYTTDLKEGWTLVERNLSLLLMPFAISSFPSLSAKKQVFLIRLFVASTAIFGLICIGNATVVAAEIGSIYTIPNNTHFLYNIFMHHHLTEPFGIHAVYFALSVGLASMVVLQAILAKKMGQSRRIFLGLLFLFFCGLIYLLKSANITLGFAICILLVIAYRYGKTIFSSSKNIALVSIGILVLGFFTYKGIQSKLSNFQLSYEMSDPAMGPLGIRLSIWDCTWQVIQENWLLGTGTGDSHHELLKKYEENNFIIGLENDFNSHNMYLQYWMSNGLLAIGIFILGFLILLKKAVQNRNVIFLCFITLFALFSLTESTMRTQKGMLFFVFFAALFYWAPQFLSKKSSEE